MLLCKMGMMNVESFDNKHQGPERLLLANEVAQRARLCEETVRRRLRTGELKAVKVGRLWRIPESAVASLFTA